MAKAVMIYTLEFEKGIELSEKEIGELMVEKLNHLKRFVVPLDAKQRENVKEGNEQQQERNSYEEFLIYNKDNPGRSVTEQKKVLKGDIEGFIERGVRDGILEKVECKKGKGRPWILIAFTDKGNKEIGLQRIGKDIETYRWQRIVIPEFYGKHLCAGFKWTIEYPVNGNGNERCDIGVIREENNVREISIEIERSTRAEWAVHNIEKCVRAGFRRVISCVENTQRVKAIEKVVREKIDSEELSKIKVTRLSEFLSVDNMDELLP